MSERVEAWQCPRCGSYFIDQSVCQDGTPAVLTTVTVPNRPRHRPLLTCDWGGCDDWAEHWRWSGGEHGWLPVCGPHSVSSSVVDTMNCTHTPTTSVDEDGCCSGCGTDLNHFQTTEVDTDHIVFDEYDTRDHSSPLSPGRRIGVPIPRLTPEVERLRELHDRGRLIRRWLDGGGDVGSLSLEDCEALGVYDVQKAGDPKADCTCGVERLRSSVLPPAYAERHALSCPASRPVCAVCRGEPLGELVGPHGEPMERVCGACTPPDGAMAARRRCTCDPEHPDEGTHWRSCPLTTKPEEGR